MLENRELREYTYGITSRGEKIKDIFLFAFLGLLLGRASLFGVIDSFYLAYVAGLYISGTVAYGGITGIILSLLTTGENGIISICVVIGGVLIFEAIKKIRLWDNGLKYVVASGVYYISSGIVVHLITNKSPYSIIYIILNTVVLVLLTPIFSAGITRLSSFWKSIVRFSFLRNDVREYDGTQTQISISQILGIIFICVLCVVGLGNIEIAGLNCVYIIMMYISVTMGGGLGMAVGAATGTALGVVGYASLSLPIDVMVLLTLMGAASGILKNKSRLWVVSGAFVTVLIFKLSAGTSIRVLETLLEAFLACFTYVLIGPQIRVVSYRRECESYVFYTSEVNEETYKEEKNEALRAELMKIKETADSMKELSFERLGNRRGMEYVSQVMNEAVQGICFNCAICRTCSALKSYRASAGIKEPDAAGELIVDANEDECVIAMLMRGVEDNSRKMLSRVDRYKTVPTAVADVISKSTELSMERITGGETQKEPLYRLQCSRISIPTYESPICGDTGSITDVPGNKTAIIVSDGCGSGLRAYEESSGAVRLIESLISRGAEMTSVIELVNALMGAENDDDAYATADILIFNNETGEGEIYKLSAVPTFIIHKNKVHTVSAQSSPLGILDKTYTESAKIKLCCGDTVVMMTDGILDADKEKLRPAERICSLLKSRGEMDPQSICNAIVDDAIKLSDGAINDDMLVICARVERARAG
ncbi:MAG: hypothetical protein E7315_03300 [Clostridiales bacterium]|nr:hypothetical protein [Clostridiales bacterium]